MSKISETIQKAINKFEISPYQINNGQCERFALLVKKYHSELEDICTENVTDSGDYPGHIWLYDGIKHYDAEEPHGVEDWRDLPIFIRIIEKKCS